MTIKLSSKLIIFSLLFVAVLGDFKATKEDKLPKEEIENRLDKYIESIGKDFVNKSVNCHMKKQPISSLFIQLQEQFSHYPFQVKSLNDSISTWYKNPEVHEPLFIKTLDPTGYNQDTLSDLITDFFVDEYFTSVGEIPVGLLENVGPLTKNKYLKIINDKYVELCPNFQIFKFDKLPLTSSLPALIKTSAFPETAIFIFNYRIELDKYRTMSNSPSIKSSDMLIFHPLTPAKNLEYLKQQWKETVGDRPRFLDQKVNIYLDKSFFEYLVNPNSHIVEYNKMIFLNKDTDTDETFYYSKDISYLIHTIKSLCECLVQHYRPQTSYYLSLNIYVQNDAVYATLRQFYLEYNMIILYYSKTYTHDRPFERLVQEEVKFGKIECDNIVSYISIFSTSAFSVSFEIVSALCVEVVLVIIFIKCLLHSWKKDEEKDDDDEEKNIPSYNSNIKKISHLRRYSGQVVYPKSPRARAPKGRALSIGVTPIHPKSKLSRRRKDSLSRPSIVSQASDSSRSLELDE